jgi:hypothetical protein
VPRALDAWIRFAGRKARLPQWAIEETREAIPRWRAPTIASPRDLDAPQVAEQFLSAMRRG